MYNHEGSLPDYTFRCVYDLTDVASTGTAFQFLGLTRNHDFSTSTELRRVSVCACLSVRECISRTTYPFFAHFVHDAYGRGSALSCGVAIRYVLPVVWMASYLHVMDHTEACR